MEEKLREGPSPSSHKHPSNFEDHPFVQARHFDPYLANLANLVDLVDLVDLVALADLVGQEIPGAFPFAAPDPDYQAAPSVAMLAQTDQAGPSGLADSTYSAVGP